MARQACTAPSTEVKEVNVIKMSRRNKGYFPFLLEQRL